MWEDTHENDHQCRLPWQTKIMVVGHESAPETVGLKRTWLAAKLRNYAIIYFSCQGANSRTSPIFTRPIKILYL
jgi:hypothetical protein